MKLNKLPQKAIDILLKRIGDELTARYFYDAGAAWCRLNGYDSAAAYFNKESESEAGHYKKLVDFLTDWNISVPFPDIAAPAVTEFTDLMDLLAKAYQMEYDLLESYEEDSVAIMSECYNTFVFLQEYVRIQNESFIEYANLINKAENYLPSDSKLALYEAEVFEG